MLIIDHNTSKAVGIIHRDVPWPTFEEVRKATDEQNAVKLLTWYRMLPSPPMEDTEKWAVLDEINRIVVAAMKRRRP